MATEHNDEIQKYKEKKSTKWAFRFIGLFSIIIICVATIHLEFIAMKKDKNQKAMAERMIDNFDEAMLAMQDSWNTMYYFYQTGDLFKILKCPNVNRDSEGLKDSMLLRLFREPYDKNFKEEQLLPTQCGEEIDVIIGEKNDPYNKATNNKMYTIKLGEEPVELISKYPLIKFALNKLRIGEKATFIAMPKEKKKFGLRNTKNYEITIKIKPNKNNIKLPTYVQINSIDNKHNVSERSVCGAIVSFMYSIRDVEGKLIGKEHQSSKVKIGKNTFNTAIEMILKDVKVGDHLRIFMTKNYYQNNDEFVLNNPTIKTKDIVIVDVLIASIK